MQAPLRRARGRTGQPIDDESLAEISHPIRSTIAKESLSSLIGTCFWV